MMKTNQNGGTKESEEINNLKEKIIWFELFVDYIYHSDFKNYKKASSYANNSMTNAD